MEENFFLQAGREYFFWVFYKQGRELKNFFFQFISNETRFHSEQEIKNLVEKNLKIKVLSLTIRSKKDKENFEQSF